MVLRLIYRSLQRQKQRTFWAVLILWASITLVTALLALVVGVRDQLGRELASLGANIRLLPLASASLSQFTLKATQKRHYLAEEEVEELKRSLFWRNNLLALSPRLEGQGQLKGRSVPLLGLWFHHPIQVEEGHTFYTGADHLYKHWKVQGRWPKEGAKECLLGRELATFLKVDAGVVEVEIRGRIYRLQVVGTVETGDREDYSLLVPLDFLQKALGLEGKVEQVDISALTTPEKKLAIKWREDPKSLTPEEYERWACTPYPGTVAVQIQNAVPGSVALVVRQVSETQGKLLDNLKGLIFWLSGLAFFVGAMSVFALFVLHTLERQGEAALMRALGAQVVEVGWPFLAEALFLGAVGGLLGAASGYFLGQWLFYLLFQSTALPLSPFLFGPLLGILVSLLGTLVPLLRQLQERPSQLLKESW